MIDVLVVDDDTEETSARITPRTTCNPTAPALGTYSTVCS